MQNRLHLMGILMFFFVGLFTFSSCDKDDVATDDDNVIQFIEDSPQFSLLAEALDEADLRDNLLLKNELTFFAPTNTAMEAFLAANNFATLSDIPSELLKAVLLGHVLDQELSASELSSGYYVTSNDRSIAGVNTNLYLNATGGTVTINGNSQVTTADQMTSDGVIHTVNSVIIPASVVTFALNDPQFSTLVAALTRSDLPTDFVSVLTGSGPFTVFAPTNAAFQALLDSNNDWNTLADIPVAVLDSVLKYHVIANKNLRASDLDDEPTETTLNTQTITFDFGGSVPRVVAAGNSANIIASDVQGANGVVHAIDTVIIPNL